MRNKNTHKNLEGRSSVQVFLNHRIGKFGGFLLVREGGDSERDSIFFFLHNESLCFLLSSPLMMKAVMCLCVLIYEEEERQRMSSDWSLTCSSVQRETSSSKNNQLKVTADYLRGCCVVRSEVFECMMRVYLSII